MYRSEHFALNIGASRKKVYSSRGVQFDVKHRYESTPERIPIPVLDHFGKQMGTVLMRGYTCNAMALLYHLFLASIGEEILISIDLSPEGKVSKN